VKLQRLELRDSAAPRVVVPFFHYWTATVGVGKAPAAKHGMDGYAGVRNFAWSLRDRTSMLLSRVDDQPGDIQLRSVGKADSGAHVR
jgi:hypothetical protein